MKDYDAFIILRPDVVLGYPAPSDKRAFNATSILRLCKDYRGYSIIQGAVLRDYWFHNRDWDQGFLLCPPMQLEDWLLQTAKPHELCSKDYPGCQKKDPQPPPQPEGFTGTWNKSAIGRGIYTACNFPSTLPCDWAAFSSQRGIPFRALPEREGFLYVVRERYDTHLNTTISCVDYPEDQASGNMYGGNVMPNKSWPPPDYKGRLCAPWTLPTVVYPHSRQHQAH